MNIEKNTNHIYQEILEELIAELLNLQESNADPELIDLCQFRISDQVLRMKGYSMDDYGKYYLKSN